MKKTRIHYASTLALLVAVTLIAAALFLTAPKSAQSSSGTPITGYVWSDTIGWISMSGSGYGVTIDSSGNLSGDAWSDSVGWVQFGGLSGFPSGSGTTAANAQVQSNGTITGWARVCAGMDDEAPNQTQPNDTCRNSYGDRTDGWEGWLSLSGSGYGPTLTNGTFSGYAWGSNVVGWVDFEYATTSYDECLNSAGYTCSGQTIIYTDSSCVQTTIGTCVAPDYCSAGSSQCLIPQIQVANFQVVPTIVQYGEEASVSWSVSNATCTVTGTNGDSWSTASGNASTSPITSQTIYTLACTGDSGANPPSTSQSITVNISPKFQEQ